MKRYLLIVGLGLLALPLAAETFHLRLQRTGKLYGPYQYEAQAPVGAGANVFELVEPGLDFKLRSKRDDTLLGPFPYEDGALVELVGTTFILIKQPTTVEGSVAYPRLQGGQTVVRLMKVGPNLHHDVAYLQAMFRALHAKYERETAPIATAPRVTGMSGFRRSGMAARSSTDVSRKLGSRDRLARREFDKFLGQHTMQAVKVPAAGTFKLDGVIPGDYVLFCEGRSRAATIGKGKLFDQVMWWLPVRVVKSEAARAVCTPDNASLWDAFYERIRTGGQQAMLGQ